MTTPGGGDNEITFVTRVVSGGDEARVGRQVGEEAGRAYREGVQSAGAAQLPPFDTSRLFDALDATVTRMEQRVASAARNMGVHLEQATAGQQRLSGAELSSEWERFQMDVERLGGRTRDTWVGSFADAVRADTRRLEAGLDYATEVNRRGQRINWALNEEGRQVLARQGERYTPGPGTESFYQGSHYPAVPSGRARGEAYEPGDLDKVRQAGMKAISRITLDDATFAFENGEFFKVNSRGAVLRSKGAVEDPAMLARLQQATIDQINAAEAEIVREHTSRVASRNPAFSQFDIDPVRDYPSATGRAVPAADMVGIAQEAMQGGQRGLIEALETLRALGVEAPQVMDALQRELVDLISAEGQAAQAAERLARETREAAQEQARLAAIQQRLSSAFASPGFEDHYGITRNNQAAQSLMRQAQDRAYSSYAGNIRPETQTGGAGGSGGGPRPPTALGTPDEFDESAYLRALSRRRAMAEAAREEAYAQSLITQAQERSFRTYEGNIAAATYRPNLEATSARERDEAYRSRSAASPIAQLAAPDAAMEELNRVRRGLDQMTEGLRTFTIRATDLPGRADELGDAMSSAANRLRALAVTNRRVGDMLSVGEQDQFGRTSQLGGTTTVRTPDGYATVAANGRLQAISETEALARATGEVTTVTRQAAAAANVQTKALHDMTDAELQAFRAAQQLNRAMASGDASQQAQALLASRRAVANLEAEQKGQGRGLGGFMSSAWTGFTMARGSAEAGDNNAFLRLRAENGEFLGAIARYQAAYAIIFGLSQGFSAMAAAEVQAQDQMVEFAHATDTAGTAATKLANQMGILGGQAGFSVAQSMEAATRGVFAFQQQLAEGASREDIASESVRQAAAIRLIAPSLDPRTSQTQLMAATNGFNLGFEGQSRVLDAAYNAMQNYGGAVEETIAALPTLSQVAEQAGLSVEEMSNLVSVAVSRTAMNGTGVASLLNRTFGNLNAKPQIRGMLEEAGIDASGDAGSVIYNLASAWDELTKAQQNAIMAQLGGHEVARALLPILNEGDNLLQANAKSYENVGSAAELVTEKQANLAGMLREVQGQLQNFGRAMVDTGAFDLIGGAIALLSPFIEGINSVLRLFTLLPGESERWVVMLAEALAILTLIGRAQANNLALQTAQTGATTAGNLAATASGLIIPGGVDLDGDERRGGRLRAGGRAVAGGLGALFTGASGAALALVALAVVTGEMVQAHRAHKAAEEQATAALDDFANARSVDELRASASLLGNAATAQAQANSGIAGSLLSGPEDTMRAESLLAQSKWASRMATQIDREASTLAGDSPMGAFFTNTGEWARDMASGVAAMTQAGQPAILMLDNLTGALRAAADVGPGVETGVYNTTSNQVALAQRAAGAVTGFEFDPNEVARRLGAGPGGLDTSSQQFDLDDLLHNYSPEKAQEAIQRVLEERGVAPGELIDDETQAAMVDAILHTLGMSEDLLPEARTRLHGAVRDAVTNQLSEQSRNPIAQLVEQGDFDRFVVGEPGGETPGVLQGILADRTGVDPRRLDSTEQLQSRQRTLLRQLQAQGQARGFGGRAMRVVEDELARVEHELVQSQIARMERLRQAALVGVTDPAEIERINTASVVQQVQAAIEAGDQTALLDVMNGATNGALDAVRALLAKALEVALAAQAEAERLVIPEGTEGSDRHLHAIAARIRGQSAQGGVDAARRALEGFDDTRTQRVPSGSRNQADEVDPIALEQARINAGIVAGDPVSAAQAAVAAADVARKGAQTETERLQAERQYKDAQRQLAEARSQVVQAQITSAVRPGDDLGAAVARVNAAKEAVRVAVRGTAEWHQAQSQLAQAQFDLSNLQNEVADARDRALNVRPGNDMHQAANALEDARDDLRRAIPGTVAYWNAYGAVEEAEHAYAQALQESRNQRRLRGTDLTDPLAMARAELVAANERVNYVKSTGNGNLDAEINAQRSAQARAEAAGFEQRMGDVQHAYDMGQMSHQAYMQYLTSEQTRLRAISNRTRQQTEQLQQIDSAIKAAADAMQGQWNIGDIRIPTPYEARRYIERSGQGAQYQQGAQISNTQTNHISFAGLTRQEVEQVLRDVLGAQATQRTATTARKV